MREMNGRLRERRGPASTFAYDARGNFRDVPALSGLLNTKHHSPAEREGIRDKVTDGLSLSG